MQSIIRGIKKAKEHHDMIEDARVRRNANAIHGYKDSQLGDGKPSKTNTFWPRHGRNKEFPSFITKPQQDHKWNGSGIKIHAATDDRAQPYIELVRANVHTKPISTIPSRDAKSKEVREYLYLILTNSHLSKTADIQPWLVCVTINNWKGNGQKLRKMDADYEKWFALCPSVWIDVSGKLHYPTEAERAAVGQHLKKAIAPIVAAEKKLESIVRYDSEDEETLVEVSRHICDLLHIILTLLCIEEEGRVEPCSSFPVHGIWNG
jgi:hypothetical protein